MQKLTTLRRSIPLLILCFVLTLYAQIDIRLLFQAPRAYANGSISGKIFSDLNESGTGSGYCVKPIPGQVADIRGPTDKHQRTDTTGKYDVDNLKPGDYKVRFGREYDPQGHWKPTNELNFKLADRENERNRDLYIWPQWTIRGSTFIDTNYNGIWDTGEAPYLATPTSIIVDGLEPDAVNCIYMSQSTNPRNLELRSGSYVAKGIIPGWYFIYYTPPPGYFITTPKCPTSAFNGICDYYFIDGTFRIQRAAAGGISSGMYQAAYYCGNKGYDVWEGNCDGDDSVFNADFGIVPVHSISGRVYRDSNSDGQYQAGEELSGVQVVATGRQTELNIPPYTSLRATTGSDGRYTIPNIWATGSYRVQASNPSGLVPIQSPLNSNPRFVNIGPSQSNVDFRFIGPYSIRGNVFIDTDGNGVKDPGEVNYTGVAPTIRRQILNGTWTNQGVIPSTNGSYIAQDLTSGTYSVSYQSLPSGYLLTHPLNGPPSTYTTVRVGSGCSSGIPTPSGQCNLAADGWNVRELNFGITAASAWIQTIGFNVEDDNSITNSIPPAAPGGTNRCEPVMIKNGNGGNPGIVYSDSVAAPNFGNGSASSQNWVVRDANATLPSSALSTSFASMRDYLVANNQQPRIITTECDTTRCDITNSTFGNRAYIHTGQMRIFSATITNNSKTLLLVDGDVYIQGPILVDPGAFLMISASGNIYVRPSVGAPVGTRACPGAVPSPQIQAILSSDHNIYLQSLNSCATGGDRQLNMAGSVITNASREGGELVNERDLCGANVDYPSFTIEPRLDFLLNAPTYMFRNSTVWDEVAP